VEGMTKAKKQGKVVGWGVVQSHPPWAAKLAH